MAAEREVPAEARADGELVEELAALVLGPMYFTWSAFVVFIVLLELTMLAGHSVGFHRRLIHRTFQCPKWLERVLVWSGTLVGMQGPFWVIQSHDFRDWAQRQPDCHAFLRHGHGWIRDGWWNLHCRLRLANPPGFDPDFDLPLPLDLPLLVGLPWAAASSGS